MPEKILLVDTSFSARPIYDYLIKSGCEVFVVGGNPNDALARSVKNYINLDYSNITELKKLIEKLNIEYLVPGGNDFSYKICSEINSERSFFNIDSIKVNELINNKEKFRRFSGVLGLNVPRIIEYTRINEFLPVIIKPVDAYSGHGITVIREAESEKVDAAIQLARHYSRSGNYIIEEYVEGQLYSHSAFLSGSEIVIDFIVEEHCSANPFVVDISRVVYDFNRIILEKIRRDIIKLGKNLGLTEGLIHTQFICNGSEFWIIEVTRRCPGDLYSILIELSTGFPYAEYYARAFIKQALDLPGGFTLSNNMVMRHTISCVRPVAFNYISFNTPITILRYVPLSLTGEPLKESPFSRAGILFCESLSEHDLLRLIDKAKNRELYSIG